MDWMEEDEEEEGEELYLTWRGLANLVGRYHGRLGKVGMLNSDGLISSMQSLASVSAWLVALHGLRGRDPASVLSYCCILRYRLSTWLGVRNPFLLQNVKPAEHSSG